MTAWNIYLHNKWIDTVFYDDDCEEWYVRKGLIEHDGYHPSIVVVKERKKRVKDV